MCGIFAYVGAQKNAGDLVLEGLRSLEYRGYDSWGVAIKQENGEIHIDKHVGKIGAATLPPLTSHAAIGHTRWATHGGVTDQNSHPHTSEDKSVIVVHNGIVENFAELKEQLIAAGHTFLSETDSEVIPHLIEDKIKAGNSPRQAMLEVFHQLKGMNAIIMFYTPTEEFFAIKNGSPLVFGENGREFILASDASAIVPHTKKVYFLEDYELLTIEKSGTHLYLLQGEEIAIRFIELQYDHHDASLGQYPHFMLKEIAEQPKVLETIATQQEESIAATASMIKQAATTYVVGCGTASYAGIAGSYLFSKLAHTKIQPVAASEFVYQLPFITPETLILALSQSGETIDLISVLKQAQEKQAKLMAITNVQGSTLYRMSDHQLLLMAGPEKAVASTKAYIAKMALLYLTACTVANHYDEGILTLYRAIEETKRIINQQEAIRRIAESLKQVPNIFILGRGVSYAAALEAALKIKEVSYIHAEGFAGGELKHGVIALIEKGTPVIVFAPDDETYEDSISSAYEVKARGAKVIGISPRNHEVFDEFIQVNSCGDATIIPNVVVSQYLGYYLAVARGFDPDKPRNLAKSVTVK